MKQFEMTYKNTPYRKPKGTVGGDFLLGVIFHGASWAISMPVFDFLRIEKIGFAIQLCDRFGGSSVSNVVRPGTTADPAVVGAVNVPPQYPAGIGVNNSGVHDFRHAPRMVAIPNPIMITGRAAVVKGVKPFRMPSIVMIMVSVMADQ